MTPGTPIEHTADPRVLIACCYHSTPAMNETPTNIDSSPQGWPAALARLWLLRPVTSAPSGNPLRATLIMGAAWLAAWVVIDRWQSQPDPQFFAYNRGRQSAFGYKFGDILHVAQSQYHDIGVARELGYTVCWIERRQGLQGFGATPIPERVTTPDFRFATLKALADAVEAEEQVAA